MIKLLNGAAGKHAFILPLVESCGRREFEPLLNYFFVFVGLIDNQIKWLSIFIFLIHLSTYF